MPFEFLAWNSQPLAFLGIPVTVIVINIIVIIIVIMQLLGLNK